MMADSVRMGLLAVLEGCLRGDLLGLAELPMAADRLGPLVAKIEDAAYPMAMERREVVVSAALRLLAAFAERPGVTFDHLLEYGERHAETLVVAIDKLR